MVRSKQPANLQGKTAKPSRQKSPVVCKGCSLPSPGSAKRCNYCGSSLKQTSPAAWGLSVLGVLLFLIGFGFWASTVPDPFAPNEAPSSTAWPSRMKMPPLEGSPAPSSFVARQPVYLPSPATKPILSEPMAHAKPTGEIPAEKLTCGGYRTSEPDKTEFAPYIQQVQKLIRQQWHPPKALESQNISVSFGIACDGKILRPRVLLGSGLPDADQSAIMALMAASPLPPLPNTYQGRYVNVEFEFNSMVNSREERNIGPLPSKTPADSGQNKKKAGL